MTDTTSLFRSRLSAIALNHVASTSLFQSKGETRNTSIFRRVSVMAIYSKRNRVGLAFLYGSRLILSQFSDSSSHVYLLTKLNILQPELILLRDGESHIASQIHSSFPEMSITELDRKCFQSARGRNDLENLVASEYSFLIFNFENSYYGFAAAAAVFSYAHINLHLIFAPKSLQMEFQTSDESALLDFHTIQHVEVLKSSSNLSTAVNNSLFGVMNHCKTKGGLRLLRLNLCQPPTFEVSIQKRLDSVSELISTPELIILLQSILTHIGDLDQLLSLTCIDIKETESFYLLEQRLNNVIALKQILHFLPSLRNALEPCSSDLLVETSQFLKDGRFEELESKIKLVVSDEARMKKSSSSMKLHRCFAIKSGLNIYLDLARNMYNDFVEELESITRILSQDHELNIKLEFTMNRGYHCSLVSRNKPFGTLPPHFLHQQIQKNKNSYTIRFTTEEIITLDRKSQNSLRECILMSNSMITELLLELRSSIGILYKFSEQLSRLDMLISFAVTSCNAGYSRPSFSATLALQNSRHPILDFMASSTTEGNNVYADEQSNFHVIMGSNMAGKSTLLRQILLLQIMAQNGCYVPCDYGSFRIVEAIFSRIGTGDSIECNASTFTLEMKEMAYIMNYITPESKTLIFVDELGRGTSNREGESLCWAIAEQLLQYSKSYTFLATHFPLLKRLDCLYPNVLSHYFLTEGQKYKCVRGHFMERDYGIQWSKKTSLPSSIIETANELAQKIREKEQMSNSNDKETCFNNNNMELFKRIQLIVKKAPKEEIGEYLKELRRSCRQEEE